MDVWSMPITVSLTPSITPDTITTSNSSGPTSSSHSECSNSPDRELTFDDIKDKVNLETTIAQNDLLGIGILLSSEEVSEQYVKTSPYSRAIDVLRENIKAEKRVRLIAKAARKRTKIDVNDTPDSVITMKVLNEATNNAGNPQLKTPISSRIFKNKFWGVCKDLGFNEKYPFCEGSVTTKVTKDKRRPGETVSKYRCTKCYKEQSQQKPLVSFRDGTVFHNTSISCTPETTPSPDPEPLIEEKKEFVPIGYRECLYILWSFSILTPIESCYLFGKSMNYTLEKEDYHRWYVALRCLVVKITANQPKIGGEGKNVNIIIQSFTKIADKIKYTTKGTNLFDDIMGKKYAKVNYGFVGILLDSQTDHCRMKHFVNGEHFIDYVKDNIAEGTTLSLDNTTVLSCLNLFNRGSKYKCQITTTSDENVEIKINILKQHICAINFNMQTDNVIEKDSNDYINSSLDTVSFFYNETKFQTNFGFNSLLEKISSNL
uniref:YqaJ domain-containing protein n=1 Tax=Strongyloides papillosus TaxID=174720 RepID=A0A0N5CE54_STREA